LYDPAKLPPIANPGFPREAPQVAFQGSHEIRRYTDQPKRRPFSEENRRNLRHAYFACISFIDTQVGRVLDELERLKLADDTVVVLWGDHGYHLGEQDMWGKITCFENAARVPLIAYVPGMAGNGQTSDALVELVDLYPSLCELARVPAPGHVVGTSFAPLLNDPGQAWKKAALTQHPRGGKVMGYSMRTQRYRYTVWVDVGKRQIVARELYDHENDPLETVNVVARSAHAKLVEQLHEQWSAALPDVATTAGPK
jgi:arylsulfatase A-like enzyme